MAGALINTGTTLFVKDGSNGGAVMTAPNQMAYVKSNNNRGGGRKVVNVVLHEDKWCKYHWHALLTLCLRIQPWLWEAVDPCWLSGGHLGSKHLAVWQVAFWVLLLALHRRFSALDTERGTGQNLLQLKQQVWHGCHVWSGHQRISEICLMEINRVSPTYSVVLSPLISCLVLPRLSMWLQRWETHKIQSTQSHAAKITLIHPNYRSPLVSLSQPWLGYDDIN